MTKIIKKKNQDKRIKTENIAFADFETILSEGNNHVVISYAITDGKTETIKSSYITSGKNIEAQSELLLLEFIELCLNTHEIVYMHNGSHFDFIFVLNILSQKIKTFEVESLCLGNEYYFIKIIDSTGNKVEFRDSYHLMPMSLKEIGKTFAGIKKVEYKIQNVNINNYLDLDIIKEVLNYNQKDSLVLKEGFLTFQKLIYEHFNVDITKTLTLASLSMKIFRVNFYEEENLYALGKKFDTYVRESYFGGKTEVFKPNMEEGGYAYDANSLYSYVMKNNLFPVEEPIFIRKSEMCEDISKQMGFFKVNVLSPSNLKYPFLIFRDTKSFKSDDRGSFTPLGQWQGTYFSEEINYAKNLGYTFEYIEGYIFKSKAPVFENFVNSLYDLRLLYTNNKGLNKVCKLLLNSLYGKFGMQLDLIETKLVFENSPEYINIFKTRNVLTVKKINKMYMLTYSAADMDKFDDYDIPYEIYSKIKKKINESYLNTSTNVAIASSITAYARIYMDSVMRNLGFSNIYYTDTDSIITSKPLANDMVSDSILGKFKLENTIKEGIFIAPKTYCYENRTGEKKIAFKGFSSHLFSYDDFKKHYFENTTLKSEERNDFMKLYNTFQIKSQVISKEHHNQFRKRLKVFDTKTGQWIDTIPRIVPEPINESE